MSDLTAKALRLTELEQDAGRWREEAREVGDWNAFAKILAQYAEAVSDIRKTLLEDDVFTVHDPAAREVIRKIAFRKPLPLQELFDSTPEIRDLVRAKLDEDEEWDLAVKHFHSRYGGEEYVRALYDTAVLILPFSEIPQHLRAYVAEARQCFALQRYLAMYVVCRAILEISLNDIHHRRDKRPAHPEATLRLSKLIEKIPDKHLRTRAFKLNDRANKVAHPSGYAEPVAPNDARGFFEETLSVVHDLYSKYGAQATP